MKFYLVVVILFLQIFLVSNCRNKNDISNNKDRYSKSESDSNRNVFGDTNCTLTEDIKWGIEQVNKGAKEFNQKFGNQDNCYLRFLDSLTKRFIETSENLYIVTLDSLAEASDGYVADYFTVVTQKLSEENFIPFFNYLYLNNKKNEDGLMLLYVLSLAYQIEDEMEMSKKEKRKEMENTLINKLKTKKPKKEELEYLKKIFKQVDKYMNK